MTRSDLSDSQQEQLSFYAFGLLTGEEAAEVERRLETDSVWQAELRQVQDTLAELAEPGEVPAGSTERLLARVQADQVGVDQVSVPANLPLPSRTQPPQPKDAPKPRAPYGPLLALLLAAAAVAAVLVLPRLNSPERQLARYQAQPGAVTTPLAANGQALGTAVRLPNGRIYVQLTRSAPPERVYQAWQVVGAAPQSLGLFDGRGFLTPPLEGKVTFAVSVEPPSGSQQPTTTPILAQEL
ncbi:anti-sigma factor domain-containing protein [Deinococcus sp.]|uniref:anti-sigma factor n=1 Tax=Deinococcus sp. TaxID=47478 RepID=UPI003B5943A7